MKPVYIFDLDGTLMDIDHRLHFVKCEEPDWDSFFKSCEDDTPILSTIETLRRLGHFADIWIWSGRNEDVSYVSRQMLWKAGAFWQDFRMRPSDSRESDHVLKQRWLDSLSPDDRARIVAVFEDRDRVVAMWRANGVPCFQVAPGNF